MDDLDRPRTPGGALQRATELQHGEGAQTDPQLNVVFVSAATHDTDTPQPLTDAGDLLFDLGYDLYTPEDE